MSQATTRELLDTRRSPHKLHERRLHMRLMSHWEDLRDGRRMPAVADWNFQAVRDIAEDCFMLLPRRPEPVFAYLGERIAASLPEALSGAQPPISAVAAKTLLAAAVDQLDAVLQVRVPQVGSGEFEAACGRLYLYRSILLPLGDDGPAVEAIVGGARCKLKPAN